MWCPQRQSLRVEIPLHSKSIYLRYTNRSEPKPPSLKRTLCTYTTAYIYIVDPIFVCCWLCGNGTYVQAAGIAGGCPTIKDEYGVWYMKIVQPCTHMYTHQRVRFLQYILFFLFNISDVTLLVVVIIHTKFSVFLFVLFIIYIYRYRYISVYTKKKNMIHTGVMMISSVNSYF